MSREVKINTDAICIYRHFSLKDLMEFLRKCENGEATDHRSFGIDDPSECIQNVKDAIELHKVIIEECYKEGDYKTAVLHATVGISDFEGLIGQDN